MTGEQEQKLVDLTEKAKSLDNTLKILKFRMGRNRKTLRGCTDTCQITNKMIGEINDRSKNR